MLTGPTLKNVDALWNSQADIGISTGEKLDHWQLFKVTHGFFLSDGSLFHVAHVWCKQGLFPKEIDLLTLPM